MSNPIKLPPLPKPANFSDVQIDGDDEFNKRYAVWGYTADQLRARDLEVARVVREAARRVIDPTRYANEADRSVAWDHYHAICVLEFTHG